jgi:hypothetical protein
MAEKNEYDWKITVWKAVKVFIYAGVAGLIDYFKLNPLPEPYWTAAVIAVLTAIVNWYKNR